MQAKYRDKVNPTFIIAFLICLIVFAFYYHTLFYPWRTFDEDIIYNETILPIPKTFSEIIELIRLLGGTTYFEASNPFYSNIANIRNASVSLTLFVFWLFQKNAFAYHLFILSIHLVNSVIFYLILDKIAIQNKYFSEAKYFRTSMAFFLTLFWSLHPVNVESVLFTSNFGALITYCICNIILFYFINSNNFKERINLPSQAILFFAFLITFFINEYAVLFPFIIFSISYCLLTQYSKESLKNCFLYSGKRIIPLLLALSAYFIYFCSVPALRTINGNNLYLTLERILWLCPQIFFHIVKLVLYPAKLSIDQGTLVKFSDTLFAPYAVFCSIFMYALVILSIVSFFLIRRKIFFSFFFLLVPFFISLIPFLQIISPTYNLSAERYLYFPSLLLVLGFSNLLFHLLGQSSQKKKLNFALFFIMLFLISAGRAYIRTFDWKNSVSIQKSALKAASNQFQKAYKYQAIANSMKIDPTKKYSDEQILKYSNLADEAATIALNELKRKEGKHIPKILKFYGLDPESLEAKSTFLLAYTNFYIHGDINKLVKIISPYIDDPSSTNTLITEFYYKILFNAKKIDAAEKLLLKSIDENKIGPILLVAFSDLCEYKYNDLSLTKKYLLQSFKYFPFDRLNLFALKRLYQKLNNLEQFAFFSHAHGLREHDIASLQDAALVYSTIGERAEAKEIILNLLSNYPLDQKTIEIKTKYESIFGNL